MVVDSHCDCDLNLLDRRLEENNASMLAPYIIYNFRMTFIYRAFVWNLKNGELDDYL